MRMPVDPRGVPIGPRGVRMSPHESPWACYESVWAPCVPMSPYYQGIPMGPPCPPHEVPVGSKCVPKWVPMWLEVMMVSEKVCRRWVAEYGSSCSNASGVLKRPASVAGVLKQPVPKRSTSSSSTSSPVLLSGACEVEATIGQRYRLQVSDLGLGVQRRDMRQRLLEWGYDVPQRACRNWLHRPWVPWGPHGDSTRPHVNPWAPWVLMGSPSGLHTWRPHGPHGFPCSPQWIPVGSPCTNWLLRHRLNDKTRILGALRASHNLGAPLLLIFSARLLYFQYRFFKVNVYFTLRRYH